MPTMSAELCPCGTELEYTGPNKNTLECLHCDRACRVQQETEAPCVRCVAFNARWNKKIEETEGPGRAV